MRLVLALPLCLALAGPALAEDTPPPPGEMEQGLSLLDQGARLLFRGLMAEMEPALSEMGEKLAAMEPLLRSLAGMVGDIRNYHPPEKLPNGDILLRRRLPEEIEL